MQFGEHFNLIEFFADHIVSTVSSSAVAILTNVPGMNVTLWILVTDCIWESCSTDRLVTCHRRNIPPDYKWNNYNSVQSPPPNKAVDPPILVYPKPTEEARYQPSASVQVRRDILLCPGV